MVDRNHIDRCDLLVIGRKTATEFNQILECKSLLAMEPETLAKIKLHFEILERKLMILEYAKVYTQKSA